MDHAADGSTVDRDRPCPPSARALLAGVVDYAGLFPPAARPMPEAIAEYAEALAGPDAWMLGRFVLPAARLAEFRATPANPANPATPANPENLANLANLANPEFPWLLSAIVRDGTEDDRAAIAAF